MPPASESAEVTMARIEERMHGMQKDHGQLVKDVQRIAESFERLAESNERVALMEKDIATLIDNVKAIWKKQDALADAVNELQLAGGKSAQRLLWEMVRYGAVGMLGAALAHFGIKLSGG